MKDKEGRLIRLSHRLWDFNYSAACFYFVTLCTHERRRCFGMIVEGEMLLSDIGQIAYDCLASLDTHWPDLVSVGEWMVMPDHVHALIALRNQQEAPSLGRVVGAYKSLVHQKALAWAKAQGIQLGHLWQRDYYDHIIRDITDYHAIVYYIQQNPAEWQRKYGNG